MACDTLECIYVPLGTMRYAIMQCMLCMTSIGNGGSTELLTQMAAPTPCGYFEAVAGGLVLAVAGGLL